MSEAEVTHRPFWTQRRYYLPMILGVLINALVYVAVTYRLATKQERLTRDHVSLTEQVSAQGQELQTLESEREKITRNEFTTTRFWTEVVTPRSPGLTEAMAELDRLAEESGVERGKTDFAFDDLDVELVQATASMPLNGTYFNLVRFINLLERSPRFFVIREIGLNQSGTEQNEIGLRCDVAFFLKDSKDAEVKEN